MISLKARRFALEYVKSPEERPSQIVMKISHKKLSPSAANNRAKKYLSNPEVIQYIEDLQSDVAKQLNLNQLKQIKKLQKIYKACMKKVEDANGNMKPVNLTAAISALSTINQMTGLDQVQKSKIEIDTDQDPIIIIGTLMQKLGNREINELEFRTFMAGLDTLSAFRMGGEVAEALKKLGLDSTKPSIFNQPNNLIENKE